MRKLKGFLLIVLLAGLIYLIFPWDSAAPEIDWLDTAAVLGQEGQIRLSIRDSGKGLRSIEVAVVQSGERRVLLTETFAGSGWPWEDRTPERSLAISLKGTNGKPVMEAGAFDVEVLVEDQPNLLFFNTPILEKKQFSLDLTPPRIELLPGPHYIRKGGSEVLVYRLSEAVEGSGVRVGENSFRGYPVSPGGLTYVCLFALAHNQGQETPIAAWAQDQAENRTEVTVSKEVLTGKFRNRTIPITDRFIEKVASDILPRTAEISRQETPLKTFVEINSRLRQLNHEQITRLSHSSSAQRLWKEPFLQLANSQVEAVFADERRYMYDGREVDRQTHLGYDLASVALSPVESANDGVILWAAYLGIYGNCVIVDHGWGLMSLYGHLSSIAVEAGQMVTRGQVLGRTGETGLAGGDHLHFTMLLQGVQVNPLEWWDPLWIDRHLNDRLEAAG